MLMNLKRWFFLWVELGVDYIYMSYVVMIMLIKNVVFYYIFIFK